MSPEPWKPILAMLLCTNMGMFALIACGDDDNSEMSCQQGFDTLTSDTCLDPVEATIPDVQDCIGNCNDDEECEDNCFDMIDHSLSSSCLQAIEVVVDSEEAVCGPCYVGCGRAFQDCVAQINPAAACVSQFDTCMTDCKSS